MKFVCLTSLLITFITDSRSDWYEVLGPSDPVFAVAGEDVILPCNTKPNISIVDMRVEWSRLDLNDSLVHLYEDHEDNNTGQSQSYRGRTELILQELKRGNASLKLSSVKVSDEGRYKCSIQFKSWYDDVTVDVKVEAIGSPPVITVDGFDGSGGLYLQCETEAWFPEPDLQWLDSKGVRLSSETTETHKNTDKFSVKHTIIVHQSEKKIHCRVKLRHHMLETLIITTSNMFSSWRTSVFMISVSVLLSVIAAILIAVLVPKYRAYVQLKKYKRQKDIAYNRLKEDKRKKDLAYDQLEKDKRQKDCECELLKSQNMIIPRALPHLRKHTAVKVTLDADSAHPRLIVSDDGKQVRVGNTQQEIVDEKKKKKNRFDRYLGVLGKEGFSSRCFYFEVQVKGQTEWDLGVTRESAERKRWTWDLSPVNGYWGVGLWDERYWARESTSVPVSLRVKAQSVSVFVDYEKGFVSFYEVESSSHIYSFTGQSFNEELYPFVSLGYQSNSNPTPLMICDDYNESK